MNNQNEFPERWQAKKLENVVTLQRGKDLPTAQREDGPYPVVGSNGIVGYHSDFHQKGPGVTVGRSGSVGEVVWIPGDHWPLNTVLWVKDFHGNDPEFIYHFLSHLKLGKYASGVSVPTLNRNVIHPLKVTIPPLEEQKAITAVLRATQNAIAARQQEAALERERKAALMQRLFTHGTRGEALKETAVGKIPQSWRVVSLEKAYKFTKKPRSLRYDDFKEIPFVPMEMIPIGKPHFDDFILKSNENLTSGTYFEPGDVLLAKITPSFENGKQGIINELPTPFGIATTEVIPIQEIPNVSNRFFIFNYLLLPDIRNNLAAKMEGTTGRQRLKTKIVTKLQIPLPPIGEQDEIAQILLAFDDKITALEKEITSLNELFQTLLEQLMTGQLSARHLTHPIVRSNRFSGESEDG